MNKVETVFKKYAGLGTSFRKGLNAFKDIFRTSKNKYIKTKMPDTFRYDGPTKITTESLDKLEKLPGSDKMKMIQDLKTKATRGKPPVSILSKEELQKRLDAERYLKGIHG